MTRTSDPYIGTAEMALMPTYICQHCDALVWDSDVSDALGELTRSKHSQSDVGPRVTGAVCPECGLEQKRG